MVKNVGFLVCVFIMVVDTVAGILGMEAEIIQNKVKHSKVLWMFECREPSYKAFQLGLAAAILLAITHFVAHLLGGCTCIWSREDYGKSSPNKQLAVVFLLFSWIALAVGLSMLIIGTLANSRSRKSCGIAHNRILFIGGIVCFVHELFTVVYYVSAAAAKTEEKQNRNPRGGHATQA
ncbi:hypothetical protein F2P56_006544 [Juglans regia]|uniref:Uncharacterized protein n=2 Tax=Juglans regia TaxID=51240 RepID=A0A833XQ87_JUGRE|nr:uncharacterized protein LOC108979340 [Juglans regia]KAF5474662.1 hypothetical protein F2P56_006544 [Juglans regia]